MLGDLRLALLGTGGVDLGGTPMLDCLLPASFGLAVAAAYGKQPE